MSNLMNMITTTCEKCSTQFKINRDEIGKSRLVHCSICENEWVIHTSDFEEEPIKLNFFSEKVDDGDFEGFTTMQMPKPDEIHELIGRAESYNGVMKHIMIVMFTTTVFLTIFAFGITHIDYVNENFPTLGRAYHAINIYPQTSIKLGKVALISTNKNSEQSEIFTIDMNFLNEAPKTELLSEIRIDFETAKKQVVVVRIIEPHVMIKTSKNFRIQSNLPAMDKSVEYVSIYVNEKEQVKHFPINELIEKSDK